MFSRSHEECTGGMLSLTYEGISPHLSLRTRVQAKMRVQSLHVPIPYGVSHHLASCEFFIKLLKHLVLYRQVYGAYELLYQDFVRQIRHALWSSLLL